MKKLILFSIVVLITVSCAPSEAEIQETVQAILAETYAAYPTPRHTTMPAHTPIQPTETAVPTATPTPPSPTPTEVPLEMSADPAFPVVGYVEIQRGLCCVGGQAGEMIPVRVDFTAASPFGRVSKMRVAKGCSVEMDPEAEDWEPFVASKTYPLFVIRNFSGFGKCVQFQDEHGNLSLVYKDNVSVEGMGGMPLVHPTDWYPQIQCFSEDEVYPAQGEVVTGSTILFRWSNKNTLPEGVFYKVFAYGMSDHPTGFLASAQTSETSITFQIPRAHAGEISWYITLVDAKGTLLDHGQCSSFSTGLLNVEPPFGKNRFRFWYRP
jgi:hypothetical protein